MKPQTFYAKDGFIKREIAGDTLLVPVGARTQDFNGMVTLNETGSFLWDQLAAPKTEQQLLDALLAEFEVDPLTAQSDLREFLEYGISHGLILCA